MVINEFIVVLLLDLLALFLTIFALFISIKVIKNWDYNSTNPAQYRLEKQVYLAGILILFILILKTINLPFFLYFLDKISPLIAGAMCAAGVINANDFGSPLLYTKIVAAVALGVWLVLHNVDLNNKLTPYTKEKFYLFTAIAFVLLVEMVLETLYFANVDVNEVVKCCSLLYGDGLGATNSGYNFTLILFSIAITVVNIVFLINKNSKAIIIIAPIFFITMLILITNEISPYVYELPTHKCPYCLLQREYNFIGYVIYAFLALSLFFQMSASILNIWLKINLDRLYFWAILATIIIISILVYYPIGYYIRNGVWL